MGDEETARSTIVRLLGRDHEVVAVAAGVEGRALLEHDMNRPSGWGMQEPGPELPRYLRCLRYLSTCCLASERDPDKLVGRARTLGCSIPGKRQNHGHS